MRLTVLIIAVCAALAGCQTADMSQEPTRPYVPTKADNTALAQAMDVALRDPASADFPVIYLRQGTSGLLYVCGLVNSKNGFGGYSGALPFYAVGTEKGFKILKIGGSDGDTDIALHLCNRAGFVGPIR